MERGYIYKYTLTGVVYWLGDGKWGKKKYSIFVTRDYYLRTFDSVRRLTVFFESHDPRL